VSVAGFKSCQAGVNALLACGLIDPKAKAGDLHRGVWKGEKIGER